MPRRAGSCEQRSSRPAGHAGAPDELRAAEAEDHEARAAADLELADLQRRRVARAHVAHDRVQRGDPARAQRLLVLQRQLRPRELRSPPPRRKEYLYVRVIDNLHTRQQFPIGYDIVTILLLTFTS